MNIGIKFKIKKIRKVSENEKLAHNNHCVLIFEFGKEIFLKRKK